MCFFRKKNVQPVIDENRFYLKVVSNGFYIEIFGYGDPKNQMSIGAGEDKHDHELTEDKFNAIKKVPWHEIKEHNFTNNPMRTAVYLKNNYNYSISLLYILLFVYIYNDKCITN